ncbi:MAG: ATP-binding protein [Lachnospiraceae bacterium]|nr:ATP-binding protein [Lachnospiraceae bacterium]
MGYYLNSSQAFSLYESETKKPYFVDKTAMLRELIPLVEQGNNHVCITRPRRFGKSVMAAMVGAFFGKGQNGGAIFDTLKIADCMEEDAGGAFTNEPSSLNSQNDTVKYDYRKYMNQHNVIYINFIKPANLSRSYPDFIRRIEKALSKDLHKEYPEADFWEEASPIEDMAVIHEETGENFILIFDEWDCIFHKDYITNEDRKSFINWLAAMTKDTGYVSLTYMTGILPIAKYSSGSTINNFQEYTMAVQPKFSEYFGFTEKEVDLLYDRYLSMEKLPAIEREDLKTWYDGYHMAGGAKLYNPRSVVFALTNNCLASYWTTSGPYSEIATYIRNDRADIRKDVAMLVAGESVKADVEEFAATSMKLTTRNEIFSAMVVYGFLNYENGKVRIPNKELMDEFAKTIREREELGYINRLAVESDRMLRATLKGDTKTMEEVLSFAHDTETPLLDYNDETELTAIVNLIYLAARDSYYVEREDKAGKGYTDFIFYPETPGDDGIILELKVDDTSEAAIRQIKDRNYLLKFQGKMAEKKRHIGRILLVGIGYDKKEKDHHCKVEIV